MKLLSSEANATVVQALKALRLLAGTQQFHRTLITAGG